MAPISSSAVAESVLTFIKGGNLQPGSKPGFGHALKLSYNLIAKERLTVTNRNKTLIYRYQFCDDVLVPNRAPTVGLFTAIMDELSTNACFAAGNPSPPGVSLQMQTELLVPGGELLLQQQPLREVDIVNTVTKLGKTVSHTRTDFFCSTTQRPLAFSSHVKYMPTGNRIIDFLFRNKTAFALYYRFVDGGRAAPIYDEKHLLKEVIGPHLEYTNTQQGRFHITREHTNPFGAMHGGCHAMIMEAVGEKFARAELGQSMMTEEEEEDGDVVLEAIQIDFIGAARGTIDFLCETIGQLDNSSIHVRVMLKKGERICSEGKLRFSKLKKT